MSSPFFPLSLPARKTTHPAFSLPNRPHVLTHYYRKDTVQIGDENVHRVRTVMDEVFGEENAGDLLLIKKKGSQKGQFPEAVNDYIVWHFKDKTKAKTRQLFEEFLDESEIARDFRMVRLSSGEDTSISRIAKGDEFGSLLKVRPLILERERGHKLFTSENLHLAGFARIRASYSLFVVVTLILD